MDPESDGISAHGHVVLTGDLEHRYPFLREGVVGEIMAGAVMTQSKRTAVHNFDVLMGHANAPRTSPMCNSEFMARRLGMGFGKPAIT